MPKPKNSDQQIPNLSQSLEELGETTTAAELVRSKGQSKKLRVITEKVLMEWIRSLLQQYVAGKEDSYSDQEKEKILKKTQDDLNLRIKRDQDAQKERDRLKADLDQAMAKIADAQNNAASNEQMAEAIEALKAKLEETEQINQDLQQDNYGLHDQLSEKLALISATIAEKEKLKETVKNQMRRSNALVENVMGLDASLYGSRHAEENPIPDSDDEEAAFYHDFEVGSKVIDTLSNDLQRLRSIAKKSAQQKEQPATADPRMDLLESDLQLLEQLKEGSLSAVDVAEPVESLVEAMNGARTEAQQLEHTGKDALGVAAGREDAIAAVPDSESGTPAEVIAGTMNVARELAAVMARGRQRLTVLKEMADQADEARNSAEQELEDVRAAYQQVLGKIAERATNEDIRVPLALKDEDAPPEESRDKAMAIIDQFKGGGGTGDAAPILLEQIHFVDDILGHEVGVKMAAPSSTADTNALAARLREDSEALHRLLKEKSDALQAAAAREKAIAEEVQALAKIENITPEHTSDNELDARIAQLSQALSDQDNNDNVGNAAQQVIAQLREQLSKAPSHTDVKRLDDERARLSSQIGQAQQKIQQLEEALTKAKADASTAKSSSNDHVRAERDMAKALIEAAQGDAALADSVADLAMVADSQEDENLVPALSEAVTGLARRKQDLSEENQRLAKELADAQTKGRDTEQRSKELHGKEEKQAAQLAQAQQRMQDLERDLSRAKTDLDLMRNQAQEANTKRSSVDAERSKAVAQVESLEQRLNDAARELEKAQSELVKAQAANKARYEAERAVATELVRAAQNDAELAEATADLAVSLEDTDASAIDNKIVSDQAAASIAILAARKQELTEKTEKLQQEVDSLKWKLKEASETYANEKAEADEMVKGVKDIINQLNTQRERTNKELESVKKEAEENQSKMARLQHRTQAAETANRQLAEALSQLASIEKAQGAEDVEDKRVDLELALSQLPDEGEDDVTIPDDLSLQLASSGTKLAESLLARRQQMTSSFKRAKDDQESLKSDIEKLRTELSQAQSVQEERDSALRSSQAEIKAVRAELTSQGKELSVKVQELTDTRGEIASIKAELDVASQRIEDQDKRLQAANLKLQESVREHERIVRELGEQQQRADAAEHAQGQLVQLLRSLTNRQDTQSTVARALTDADMADPLSKAAQKLDMARAAGPEQLATAGQSYVQALKDRVQKLAEELEEKRGHLNASKTNESALQDELAAMRASIVDRDHQLQNQAEENEKAKAAQADLLNQLMEQRRAHDDAAAELKQVQEELRLAQAEVADYTARDGASSGHLSSDIDRLRQELEKERSEREQAENELSEMKERAESGDARMKAQRDEFMRRLTERDQTIEEKERQLNELTEQRADTKGLQAEIEARTNELNLANDRIRELEMTLGQSAGTNAKTSDLAKELKNVNKERDALREKIRQVEFDLADSVSENAQMKAQLDEKRKDAGSSREKLAKEMSDLRDQVNAVREESRKIKEENVGLKAKIRRLTDNSSGPSGGFPITK